MICYLLTNLSSSFCLNLYLYSVPIWVENSLKILSLTDESKYADSIFQLMFVSLYLCCVVLCCVASEQLLTILLLNFTVDLRLEPKWVKTEFVDRLICFNEVKVETEPDIDIKQNVNYRGLILSTF